VELNVKFLLNQQKVNPLDVKIVLERTDLKEASAVVEEDSAEAEAEEDSIEDLEKCIKQHVLNVSKNVKFLSSQVATNQFIVRNVS
jgi:hypothetical protein